MRPVYLEPRTDVPAVSDWSTQLILDEFRPAVRWSSATAVAALVAALCLVLLLPVTAGTVAAVVVLGLVGLFAAIAPLAHWVETAPRRRGLLDKPWRRCPATVAAGGGKLEEERLLVFDGAGTLVLRGTLPDAPSIVLDRQEVFLCGPDEEGRAVVRVAGLCQMYSVRVDDDEARPREREPHVVGRPLDDPVVARAFRRFRWGRRAWLWAAVPALVGAVCVALALVPLSVPGLVVGGSLLVIALLSAPASLLVGALYRDAVAAVESAPAWTPVPVTLFPWEPDQEVSGLAQLPGGAALVSFPLPKLDVIANIADTGTMWIAGEVGDVVAVGLPRVPVLTVALVQPDRDKPDDKPHPWILRAIEPAWDRVPAMRD